MVKKICLDNLPHTVALERDPEGRACFSYVDQRKLPDALHFERTREWHQVVDAIKDLGVRGAPAIGIAGAGALALWACNEGASRAVSHGCSQAMPQFLEEIESVADEIVCARPTAVNLEWAVRRAARRAQTVAAEGAAPSDVADFLFTNVKRMEAEDEATNRAIGEQGAALVGPGSRLLTHCNAGSLATAFYGTALGIVYAAAERGLVERVYADETRPVGQGARLTAWELSRVGIPCTLICDNMAASLMAAGQVDAVFVGADRIAANGDVANKIGTYGVAVLARYHGIPFYVAAPTSTIDFSLADGSGIPIEQREPSEVLPRPLTGVEVWNPAFDVTPADLITAIVTEQGVFEPGRLS
ncbi:MAG: S-methyl-5-thioribose-1-phosphate isomerase [Gordonibacter sp.]|nr:S-methyl-5-thioribose-1-phosphate isomerase [Gordonibacter sp.]